MARLRGAARRQQSPALQECKRRVIHAVQGLQSGDGGECLVRFAVEYQKVGERPEDTGVSGSKLRGDKQIRGAALHLPMTPVQIAEHMQELHRVMRVCQVSTPPCKRPSSSRWRS